MEVSVPESSYPGKGVVYSVRIAYDKCIHDLIQDNMEVEEG